MIIKASASITLTRVDDGDDGKGIKSIVNKYLASSSGSNVTTATSGWTNTIQTITTSKRYLWNYEVITYTDNSTTTTTPVIIGVYGNTGSTGATGNGVSSITEYYLVSPNKSGVTTSTSGWSTTIPTMTATNKYLWNYEVIKYTNSTTSTGTPKVIGIYGDKGDKGDKGETGVGISSVDVEYYLSTSSTAQSGGSWSTTAPTWVNGKYMWSRTKTVTTAGKTTYSNPVCITGAKGSTGATGATGATGSTGKGVSSITEEYYLSTSKTTQSGGSWVATPPTWSSGKYMWTRSKIVYTNPASTVYTAPVCDSSWEAVNEIDIGGRNLALKTSSSYSTAFSSFSGVTNTCPKIGNVLTDGLKAGDTITIRMIYKYTDIVAATGQTARCWIQGSGDVTGWNSGAFQSSPRLTLSGSGEYEFLYNLKITADHVKNSYWGVNIRHDYVQSGSIQFKMFKVEKGNKPTDWTPAPEDIDGSISSLTERVSRAEQKITDSAIISTVQSTINAAKNEAISSANTNTTNQLKNYATKSSLTQTATSIEAKFSSSGGYNLLKNSAFANKQIDNWWVWGGVSRWATESYYKEVGDMYIANPDTNNPGGLWQSEIPIKPNTKYTLSVACYKEGNVKGGRFVLEYQSSPDSSVIASQNIGLTFDDKRHSYTFTTPNNSAIKYAKVGFRHEGSITTGGGYLIKINKPCLAEGEVSVWSPNPFEIKDGSTMIDASGVTIKNGALRVQNNAGQTVLSGDSNGNLNLTSIGNGLSTDISSGRLTLNNTSTGAHMDLEGTTIKLYDYSTIDERAEISKSTAKLTISSWSQKEIPSIDLNTDTVNIPNKLSLGGRLIYKGNIILNGSDTWLRTYGNTGWYNETYAGGWYMTDYNWIRAYNGRNIYTSGSIKTDGNSEIGGYMKCNKLTVGNQDPNDMTHNAPWYGLGRTNYTCGVSGNNAVQLGGYGGITLRTVNTIFELRGDSYILSQGHLCPFNTRTNWLGTNTPDRQWKGLCAEGGTVGASDIRSKENIERLDGTIVGYDETTEEVKEYQLYNLRSTARASARDYYEFIKDRFKPSYYNYKLSEVVNEETGEYTIDPADEYNMLKNVGFIAQDYDLETDSVAREFIFQNESGEYSYNHMSYVTVGMIALQEATKKIDLLENENMELKERLSKLENLVNQIISK